MYPDTADYQFISWIELSIQEINKKIALISDWKKFINNIYNEQL